MYKIKDKQLSLTDFGQAVGLKLNPENRWIKKAQSIPWEEIEIRYAQLFTSRKGNVAKPLRLGLGACIIQTEYGYSDEEIVLQIQEGPYLQYFCGYREYDDSKLPFDPSLMVYFRKRLTPEVLGEINEMIIAKAQPPKTRKQKDDKLDTMSNSDIKHYVNPASDHISVLSFESRMRFELRRAMTVPVMIKATRIASNHQYMTPFCVCPSFACPIA